MTSSSLTWSVTNETVNSNIYIPDEQRLYQKLMSSYEKAVRPVLRASDPVVVKLGITLTQIMDVVSCSINKKIS